MDTFALLMVIALGTLAGSITGLVIGFAAKRQKPDWSLMTLQEKRINIALVLFFSVVFCSGLLWYATTGF